MFMRIKKINIVKEFLLWIYMAAVTAGIVYAACMEYSGQSPADIIYEKTHRK